MKRSFLSAVVVASFLGVTSPLAGQGLSGKIGEMIKFGTCEQSLCLVTGAGPHQAHFLLSAQTASTDLLTFLNSAITSSVASLPIGSTSGGTTFSFVGGAPVRQRTSAGPIFGERASTMGKGRMLVGLNTTHIAFNELRGVSTKEIGFNLSHQDVGAPGLGDAAVEDDVIGIDINMKLNLQVTTLFATYGITDRLDVSAALPFVMSSLDGTARGHVYNVTGTVTGLHFFGTAEAPNLEANSSVSGSAAGIGDVALRAKFLVAGSNSNGVSVLGDVRLPTGSEEDFHGAGKTSMSGMVIASTTRGNFSPHANVGFVARSGEGQTNAMLVTIGFDQMLTNAATIAVDLLSQMQAGGNSGTLPPTLPIADHPVNGTNIPDEKDSPIGISAGGRFLVGSFTVLANGLVPVKTGGLQSKFIWTLGIQRTF